MTSRKPAVPLDPSATLEMTLEGVKLIEASAGTGKTYTIANLYLRHILEGLSPAEILVVTFTNAATDELRGRIRARLHDTLQLLHHLNPGDDQFLALWLTRWLALDPELQQLQKRRLQLALRSMDEAAIYTIHGFCQRALSDHALHSGQAFDLELMQDDHELWETALKDWWRIQSYQLDANDWTLFNSSLVNLSSLLDWQQQFRASEKQTLLPEISATLADLYLDWKQWESALRDLALHWQQQKQQLLDILQQSKALKRTQGLPYHKDNLGRFMAKWDAYFNSSNLLQIPDSLQYLRNDRLHLESKPSQQGKDPDLDHEFFLALQRCLEQIAQFKRRFRARALVEANAFASQRVLAQKLSSRSLAYQDQLTRMRDALQHSQGALLAERLRSRYPVAMIDEFQDTDSVQYEIFYRLYFNQQQTSLTLIGDPKQAIYSFRGGDIFTYMKAKNEACVNHYSLRTNWRSEAPLVNAVNCLFAKRSDAFIYTQAIDFEPVSPAPDHRSAALRVAGEQTAAMTIWQIPLNEKNAALSKADAYSMLHQACAEEIRCLIQGGNNGDVMLGSNPLRSGDIAILVRTNYEGTGLRAVLASRGIKSVSIGRDQVFDSAEAEGLFVLLLAINHPADRSVLRAALASSLLALDYLEIAAIADHDQGWQDWIETFIDLHQLWLQKGFIVMFQQLLQKLQIGERLSAFEDADRRLTNLLHLVELLQQQARLSPGFDVLLGWYQQQILEPSSEETELRLESDDELVKIVTIHRSKGLEYPVVFLPYLWNCKPRDLGEGGLLRFHDDNHDAVLDLGSTQFEQHAYRAEKERLAEDIRLAYVAITRARARVYLAWGKVGKRANTGSESSALAYLLHARQSAQQLDSELPQGFGESVDIDADLHALALAAQGDIEVIDLPAVSPGSALGIDHLAGTQLTPAVFKAPPRTSWRISSFSSLTRDIHQVSHGGSSGRSGDAILDFPAGSHVGLLLHELLEHLDFQGDIKAQCTQLLPGIAPRFDLDSSDYQATIAHWMQALVDSPLNPAGLTLARLANAQRLNELAFDFALQEFDSAGLNSLCTRIAGAELEAITPQKLRGMITGVIDLVFEHEGRYYLADYKSNFLGASLDDYTPDKLHRAVLARRYDLQYLIYSIALHRYLGQRLENYDYEQHFGGAYYLFLRAMRPQSGVAHGVYYQRPSIETVAELDQLLNQTEASRGQP